MRSTQPHPRPATAQELRCCIAQQPATTILMQAYMYMHISVCFCIHSSACLDTTGTALLSANVESLIVTSLAPNKCIPPPLTVEICADGYKYLHGHAIHRRKHAKKKYRNPCRHLFHLLVGDHMHGQTQISMLIVSFCIRSVEKVACLHMQKGLYLFLVDGCRRMHGSICMGICINMCRGTRVNMYMNMHAGMPIDISVDMLTDKFRPWQVWKLAFNHVFCTCVQAYIDNLPVCTGRSMPCP